MVFRDKYELLALRGGDKEIALPGREIASARPILLHLLTGGYAPENQELLRALENLSADHRAHLLDSGDHDGIPYVVTDTLPGNLSLRSWVVAAVVMQPVPPAEPPVQPTVPAADPGEFTLIFQASNKRAEPEAPLAAARTEPPQTEPGIAAATVTQPLPSTEPPVQPAPPSAEPGEFTLIFQASTKPAGPDTAIGEFTRLMRTPAPAPAPAPAKLQQAAAPQAEPAAEPSAFTAAFQSQPRSSSAAAGASSSVESTGLFQGRVPSPPPQSSTPGEFTRAMQPPLARESNYPKPAPAAAAPQGEFTRIMEGSALPKPPVARQDPLPQTQQRGSPQSQGEFTRIFEAEPTPTGNLAAPASSQAPLPHGGPATGAFARQPAFAGSSSPAGESEFTKMISVSSPPPVAAAPKAPKPAAGKVPAVVKANRSYLPLVLILAGLFVLAVIVILVLTLSR